MAHNKAVFFKTETVSPIDVGMHDIHALGLIEDVRCRLFSRRTGPVLNASCTTSWNYQILATSIFLMLRSIEPEVLFCLTKANALIEKNQTATARGSRMEGLYILQTISKAVKTTSQVLLVHTISIWCKSIAHVHLNDIPFMNLK